MKNLDIITEYINYYKKNLDKIAKLSLGKYYSKSDFSILLDTFINVKFYDSLERKSNNGYFNVKSYIRHTISKLKKENEVSDNALHIYEQIINLEQDKEVEKDFINSVKKFQKEMDLTENHEKEITEILNDIKNKSKEMLIVFDSKDFSCEIDKTNIKDAFIVDLKYWFKIPRLYSDYAIQNVYNTGIINEDRLMVEYSLISKKLLDDIKEYNYSSNYIVDFACTLFEKETKLKKIIGIISNEICKERLVFKLKFNDFVTYKDNILKMINNGYNFAIFIDEDYKDSIEYKKIISSVFKYIIIENNIGKDIFKSQKNVIKMK